MSPRPPPPRDPRQLHALVVRLSISWVVTVVTLATATSALEVCDSQLLLLLLHLITTLLLVSHFSQCPEVPMLKGPCTTPSHHHSLEHRVAAEEKNLKIKIAKINLRIRTNEWMMIPILALSGQPTPIAHYREERERTLLSIGALSVVILQRVLYVCVVSLSLWTGSIYQESFKEDQERLMRSNLQINIIGRCVVNTQLFINKSSSSHTATGVEESRRSRPPPNNYERLAGLADQPARLTTTTTNTTTDDDTEADQELDLIIPI